jgi:hypothetical protein
VMADARTCCEVLECRLELADDAFGDCGPKPFANVVGDAAQAFPRHRSEAIARV